MRLMICSLMGVVFWGGLAQADTRKDKNDSRPTPSRPTNTTTSQPTSRPTQNNNSQPTTRPAQNNNRPDTRPAQQNNNRPDTRPTHNDNRPTQHNNNRPDTRPTHNDNRPTQHNDNRRNDNRPNNTYNRNDNRPNNTYNRNDNRRDYNNRPNNTYNRNDNRRVNRVEKQYRRQPYRGTVRTDRQVVTRTKLYHSNGVFRFHGGRTVVYRAPVITQRYYSFNVRPTIFVENYPAQYGYTWVGGNWAWNGGEWIWTGGYYAPDPAISVYYDDGSYDVGDEYVDDE